MGFGDFLDKLFGGEEKAHSVKAKCPKCGAEVDTSMERCPGCGTHTDLLFRVKCPKCGTPNDLKAKRCSKCEEVLWKEEKPYHEKVTFVCPRCGFKADYLMEKCPGCGIILV